VNEQWTVTRYCDLLVEEVDRLARVVAGADLTRPAPTCPGWTLADVVRQTGEMFRWIHPMVRDRTKRKYGYRDVDLTGPTDTAEYGDWMVASGQVLLDALRSADPDRPMWSWGYEQTVRFWARRVYYNTAVHRADAEIALELRPEFSPDVAVDGTDEFLQILPYAAAYSPRIAMLRGRGETLRLTSPGTSWFITLTPKGYTWRRDDGGAGDPTDTTIVTERPDDALLFVWGRLGSTGPHVTGDRRLAATWTELSAFN